MTDIQIKFGFTNMNFPYDAEPAFKIGETVFIGEYKELVKARTSVQGIVFKIPEQGSLRDIISFELIRPFWYDCLNAPVNKVEDKLYVIIKNDFEVSEIQYKNFLDNVGLACKNEVLKLNEPPSAPDLQSIPW